MYSDRKSISNRDMYSNSNSSGNSNSRSGYDYRTGGGMHNQDVRGGYYGYNHYQQQGPPRSPHYHSQHDYRSPSRTHSEPRNTYAQGYNRSYNNSGGNYNNSGSNYRQHHTPTKSSSGYNYNHKSSKKAPEQGKSTPKSLSDRKTLDPKESNSKNVMPGTGAEVPSTNVNNHPDTSVKDIPLPETTTKADSTSVNNCPDVCVADIPLPEASVEVPSSTNVNISPNLPTTNIPDSENTKSQPNIDQTTVVHKQCEESIDSDNTEKVDSLPSIQVESVTSCELVPSANVTPIPESVEESVEASPEEVTTENVQENLKITSDDQINAHVEDCSSTDNTNSLSSDEKAIQNPVEDKPDSVENDLTVANIPEIVILPAEELPEISPEASSQETGTESPKSPCPKEEVMCTPPPSKKASEQEPLEQVSEPALPAQENEEPKPSHILESIPESPEQVETSETKVSCESKNNTSLSQESKLPEIVESVISDVIGKMEEDQLQNENDENKHKPAPGQEPIPQANDSAAKEEGKAAIKTVDVDLSEKLDNMYITPIRSSRKSRILIDSTNIVESSAISFVEVKNKDAPSEVLLTPVRRSTRKKAPVASSHEPSQETLRKAKVVPNPFLNA